jgi:hypothetical protein
MSEADPLSQRTDASLSPAIARRLSVRVLSDAGRPLKRDDLARQVVDRHERRGGSRGQQHPQMIVKKALGYLREDGIVEKADGFGCWRLRREPDAEAPEIDDAEAPEIEEPDAPVELPADITVSPVSPDAVPDNATGSPQLLGTGSECVYVYYYQTERELAYLKGCDVWECKIGKHGGCDPTSRINAQARTARSRPPVVALVLLTEDSFALERALHASLRLLDAQIDGGEGQEWFTTNPDRIGGWYLGFQESLRKLLPPTPLPRPSL